MKMSTGWARPAQISHHLRKGSVTNDSLELKFTGVKHLPETVGPTSCRDLLLFSYFTLL